VKAKDTLNKLSININKNLKFSTLKDIFFKGFKPVLRIKVLPTVLINLFMLLKTTAVSKFYWGRGGLYKKALHGIVLLITGIVVFSGLSSRLFGLNNSNIIQAYNPTIGNVDLLEQGGGLQTIIPADPNVTFSVKQYTASNGDTLQSVADKYRVTKDTIKWANPDKFGTYTAYTSEKINPGDQLSIPEISGVLYNVKSDDTLDTIISKTAGDKFQVVEINGLEAPDYSLKGRSKLLIPNGSIKAPNAPPSSIPVAVYVRRTVTAGDISTGGLGSLNGIAFSNPLSDPDCRGYGWSRGFGYQANGFFHDGVDLPKGGGCPVRAACTGNVEIAGWQNGGQGFNIRINCGNGIQTSYYHSNGDMAVKVGDHVNKGQFIMEMGCSGNCTGTHLHFGLRLNGQFIDPSPYVPY